MCRSRDVLTESILLIRIGLQGRTLFFRIDLDETASYIMTQALFVSTAVLCSKRAVPFVKGMFIARHMVFKISTRIWTPLIPNLHSRSSLGAFCPQDASPSAPT
jgi:hypothetical protein